MKITLVCQEIPYPAIHGSRIDMWRRIKAFADRGVELQIITWWFGTRPTNEEVVEIQKYAKKTHLFQIHQTAISRLQRVFDLLDYPLETTSRMIKGASLVTLEQQVREFDPDLIFLDGLHGGVIATQLSSILQIPLFTRSHNIEHLYARRMLDAAIGFKDKFRRYLSTVHLEKYEKKLLSNSSLFYDISADDLGFWQGLGFTNGRLLPPIVQFPDRELTDFRDREIAPPKTYDLVFLGNLNTENNVSAAIWFLTEVLPVIRERLPAVTVAIAGFKPVDRIVKVCERIAGVDLIVNPKSASEIYRSGRVLINPILTGSGVKIKSIEMLTFGKPIVSTSEGVSGLPEAIKQYFRIANDPATFAAATLEFLEIDRHPALPSIDPELLASFFGAKIIDPIIAEIESTIHR